MADSLKSTKLFTTMADSLKANGKAICTKVNAIFNFEVQKSSDDKNPVVWTIDFKNAPGEIKQGRHEKPDATFTMLDENIILISEGKLNGQQAFMQGKMKIKGNMAAAMKFTPDLLKPAEAPKAVASAPAPSAGSDLKSTKLF